MNSVKPKFFFRINPLLIRSLIKRIFRTAIPIHYLNRSILVILCYSNLHVMYQCLMYPSVECKLKRCKDLYLCDRCAKPGHQTEQCKAAKEAFKACKICNQNSHYRALFFNKDTTSANICLSSALIEHDLLLPQLEVIVH